MPNYRRIRIRGGTYFFTVALADRTSTLLVDRIADLGRAFRAARATRPFSVEAIVVLPDHLHALWTLPPGDDDYPTRWAHIKATFSRTITERAAPRSSLRRKRERGIWQRRYWARAIENDRDFSAHADYIHFNPVKHGWVTQPDAWRWSSVHRFVRKGWLEADWGSAKAASLHRVGFSPPAPHHGGLKPTL